MPRVGSCVPAPARPRVLLLDNYDSFTWNLAQYLEELGAAVDVRFTSGGGTVTGGLTGTPSPSNIVGVQLIK